PSGWSLTAACLSDAAAPNRLLSTSSNFMTTLTPSVCAANCDSQGYTYAAVQDGHECWCASSLNNGTTAGQRADVSNCATPCAGDASQNCGGVWFVSIHSLL
ncbi:carbohydrate-binding WSC, partial [Clavulina sp. PMI_390]